MLHDTTLFPFPPLRTLPGKKKKPPPALRFVPSLSPPPPSPSNVHVEKKPGGAGQDFSTMIFRADEIGKRFFFFVFGMVGVVVIMGVGIVGRADVVHLEHVAAFRTAADGPWAG